MRKTKKRFLSALLACAMLISLFPFAAFADSAPLPDAEDGVIKLTENVTLSNEYTVQQGESVTIDLNGYTITNASGKHTIVNYGTLVINDSSVNKTGVVDNTSHGKAAIYNYPTGNVTLNGGTYDRSYEKGSASNNNGGNSFYTLKNFGTMTINPGVTVQQDGTENSGTIGKYSSLVANGWQNISTAGQDGKEPAKVGDGATLIINGGTFNGGLNTIKNDDCGTAVIKDGTFTNFAQAVVQNHNVLTIEGGNYTASADTSLTTYGVDNCGCAAESDIGTLTITGGKFASVTYAVYDRSTQNAQVNISGGSFTGNKAAVTKTTSSNAAISITGGTFSSDVSSLVAEGYNCVSQSGKYVVQNGSQLEADAVVSGDTSNATVGGNYSGDESNNGVDTTGGTVSIDVSNAQSGNDVTTSNVSITNNALTSLNNATGVQNVAIKTDVATVTMDSVALDAMTANAKGDGIALTVEKTAVVNNAPLTYSITAVTSDGEQVYNESVAAGSVTISVPYINGTNPQVYYVGANGLENMNATVANGALSWKTSHFSDYVVLSDSTIATVTDNGAVTAYDSLEAAITAANGKDTNPVVDIVKNATITTTTAQTTNGIVPINKTMTINGHGNTISYTGTINTTTDPDTPQQGGLFVIGADNVVMKDITIDVEQIKHAVQFYKTTGGELNNVTINGADWTAVQVNGAQKVALNNCVLNPNAGAYANIEYAMGGGVTTIPSMTMENVSTTGDSPAVWVDHATVTAMKDAMDTVGDGSSITDEQVQKELLKQVTYTSDNGGSLALSVQLAEDAPGTPVYVESTYQPPYTGKYSYEITVADTDNGTVSVDKYATEGEDVTITVTPDKGYKLDELTVTAGSKDVDVKDNGNGTYTFTMPSSKVKVAATFVEDENYDDSITISMTVGSNDFVINDTIVTIPDAAPYIANSRTYVPFRALGEAIGADVVWDNDARTVTYTLDGNEIVMTIGSTTYTVNGVEKTMDVAPEITGERTYVPIRFIGEALGFKVTPLYAEDGTTASVVFEK